jgi:O-antigen/teichoic acid export membrane protein
MKKIIICTMMLAIAATSFSQDYLRKSKNQKTAAWILLGGGSALVVTGILLANNATIDNLGTGAGVAIAGGVAVLGSIPLFLASGRNKKNAMSLSSKNEKMQQLNKNSFVYKPVPSLSLKISL